MASHTGLALERQNVRARASRSLVSAGELTMKEGSFPARVQQLRIGAANSL